MFQRHTPTQEVTEYPPEMMHNYEQQLCKHIHFFCRFFSYFFVTLVTDIICSHQVFDILLLELEPVCTAEQEFVQTFFDFTLDEPEVCVFG